jgi:outer membrane biosynthesis protein TonB
MTTQMTNHERLETLTDDYRDAPIAQIEYELGRLRGSDEHEVLHQLLNDARAADAPEQQRHRWLKRWHLIAAAIALIGVVAPWLQACRPSQPSAAFGSPTPATIWPVAAPEESPPAPEESSPAPEESPPTPEESVLTPEESVLTPEESAPTADESVPQPDESVPPSEESPPAPEESAPTPEP